ncbi:MAG: TIGR03790 family protein [Fimbriimonadaceae bacterium]|nr:TIGR03790 family protein [Fimbriimonadaceae bacterium]
MPWFVPNVVGLRPRSGSSVVVALLLPLVMGCAAAQPKVIGVSDKDSNPESRRVLLVANAQSETSLDVARYYGDKRKIPRSNVVLISCAPQEQIPKAEYLDKIEEPVRAALAKVKGVDFVVLAKDVPLRLDNEGGFSVDGQLAGMDLDVTPIEKPEPATIMKSLNPYYGKRERFSSKAFKMVLVTRLDGWTAEDAKALVDRSLAAKPNQGLFFFDGASNRRDQSYGQLQRGMSSAATLLTDRAFDVLFEDTTDFVAPSVPLAGYVSWGSNDGKFSEETYKKLSFKPGAIGETFVSTSGRTFRKPPWGTQSLVADLVAGGITGVKAYVSEPFTFALARPEILFDRYTNGYNLAESFYCASPIAKWKDIVIGDPLCNPYRRE